MKITLKDNSVLETEGKITALEAAKKISEGLAKAAVACEVDGVLKDLSFVLEDDCKLNILTLKDEEGLKVYRHTAAHILAQAVKNLYPTVKLAIGPAISNGFYYDFDFVTPITIKDLEKIEQEMQAIIKADFTIKAETFTRNEAKILFSGFDEKYKLELLKDIPKDQKITVYRQGDFVDLCRGPHLPSTGYIKCIKLTSLAGAYWRGKEGNKMLTRIYGTAFEKKNELAEYLKKLEEAKLRDHNKLGRELGIFMTDENIGQGLPLLMPKGAKILQIIQRFVEDEEEKRGYLLTKTPSMAKSNLYKMSGHWDHYKDKMFILGDEKKGEDLYALRPMTCPFQFTIYNNGIKSYKELPIRYAETASLFRKETSGEMHGLIRVRQFTLSDGHIVCTPSQVENEFREALDLINYILKCLGLENEVTYRFSRWDPKDSEKYIGTAEQWETTEGLMETILKHLNIDYATGIGEAAFYGPKLDVQTKNVHGKEDTLITIQIDFALAERFDMSYVDEDGIKKRPLIIHRSSIGCYERTLAMLIEKYNGALPLWMSPTQVRILTITDRAAEKATEISTELRKEGIRTECDMRNEKIGYKIREARLEKIPYMVIIGDSEIQENKIAVRSRSAGDLGTMEYKDFLKMIQKEIKNKTIDYKETIKE